MKFSEVKLPSNRKFGFFFAVIFGLAASYFYAYGSILLAYSMTLTSAVFLCITIAKANILLPLNILWMKFGVLLGMIVSPIVLGIIFFGIFAPIAILMRMSGRDELRLKLNNKPSHWISRGAPIKSESFKQQF